MAETSIQTQINEINSKLDLLLEYVNQQRLKSQATEDLISDVSILAKDAYQSTVKVLDDSGIELDMDELKQLILSIVKNIPNINRTMRMLESLNDLATDLAPIGKEMAIDFIHLLHELEQKGLFEYIKELQRALGIIRQNFSPDDMHQMVDNMGTMIQIVKNFANPGFLKSMEQFSRAITTLELDPVKDKKSLLGLLRELNDPEIRTILGFSFRAIKTASSEITKAKQ